MKEKIKKLLREYRDLNFTSAKQAETYSNGYAKKLLDLLSPNKTKTLAPSPITKTNAISDETPRRGIK